MPLGRPTLYREEYDEQAYRLALLGMTDEEVAKFFQVHVDTIYEWDKVHPSFSEARASGKESADAKVAERLYKRALGYSHDAVKIFMGHEGEPVYAAYTEHYPPDTQAARWWLQNRQGKKWQDKSAIQQLGKDGQPVDPAQIQPIINVTVAKGE